MRAEIIAVGTELLLGQIANTNAQYISDKLALEGIDVFYHQAVGDNEQRLKQVLEIAKTRSELIVLSGGLGPTDDDLTRESTASFLGKSLHTDASALTELEGFFSSVGREMTSNNKKQVMLIEGGRLLANPRGTAPGQYVQADGRHYFLLPGPPTELRPMVDEQVIPIVRAIMQETVTIRSRVLRLFGIGESAMETQITDILQNQSNPTVAPLASEGEVTLRITAKADSEAHAYELITPVEESLRQKLGTYIYGIDNESLPVVVGKVLNEREQTVSFAESCTGGMLASMVTDVAGSSQYFRQSWVTYSNEAKATQLGVPQHILEKYGAVSEECARSMAEGARQNSGSDWAVSVTGIAGPDGGTPEKPVGLVYIGVAGPNGCDVKKLQFRGDRQQIRIRSAKNALYYLVNRLR